MNMRALVITVMVATMCCPLLASDLKAPATVVAGTDFVIASAEKAVAQLSPPVPPKSVCLETRSKARVFILRCYAPEPAVFPLTFM